MADPAGVIDRYDPKPCQMHRLERPCLLLSKKDGDAGTTRVAPRKQASDSVTGDEAYPICDAETRALTDVSECQIWQAIGSGNDVWSGIPSPSSVMATEGSVVGDVAMIFVDPGMHGGRVSERTRGYNRVSNEGFVLSSTSSGATWSKKDFGSYVASKESRNRGHRLFHDSDFDFGDVTFRRTRDAVPCWPDIGELNPPRRLLDAKIRMRAVQCDHGCDHENGGDGGRKKALVESKGGDGLWSLNRGGNRGARGEILIVRRASLLGRLEPVLSDHHVLLRLSLQHAEGDVK